MRYLKTIQIVFLAVLFSLTVSNAYGDDNWPFIWPDDAVQPTNLPATIDTKVNDPCYMSVWADVGSGIAIVVVFYGD